MTITKILEIGFLGIAGEGWLSVGIDDFSAFRTILPIGTAAQVFNFGTNVTADFLPLWEFGQVLNFPLIGGTSQFVGSGSVLGLLTALGLPATPFDALSIQVDGLPSHGGAGQVQQGNEIDRAAYRDVDQGVGMGVRDGPVTGLAGLARLGEGDHQ